ncbi:GNAT family N-acetyltransferase [Candidatus Xianfuyuplasma coldseepsis]|uniref:GNAT family N-acetyltransferase n=1 Tax=Candidatus Xianfuyuplasma coldseepsis TaxID=2782163 RepID=A0A7L7KSE6_9MOLU|nr:GNAT family protein [Xianfuyuplasma coldseepsis]QMS85741.1 GNAT family N-acetyltransferase [Xianfuyuplasma coldseepsis]
MKEFNTERLLLRELQQQDANDIYEYCSMKDVIDMIGMRLHSSIEITYKYISHEQKKSETLAIVNRKLNKVIGTVSLRKQYNDSNLDIRLISCIINPKYWGKGYAPEAIQQIIMYAFEELNVHKLLGGHYSFNLQSSAVNRKLGFVYEGTQREVYLYNGKLVDAVEYGMLERDYMRVSQNWK